MTKPLRRKIDLDVHGAANQVIRRQATPVRLKVDLPVFSRVQNVVYHEVKRTVRNG